MSPKRQKYQRASNTSPKPYSTTTLAISKDKCDIAQTEFAQKMDTINNPGFPTYTRYKELETAFIESLHPRRQAKVLISQDLFDRIWDVLHNKSGKSEESAQFRFWARRKFTLGTLKHSKADLEPSTSSPPQTVLLHENNIVAIQEQMYDLLCYCHGATNHAGRDRTCAAVRKHYTWVPKELIARFIKACPTCIAKKCGFEKLDGPETNPTAQNPLEPSSLRNYLRSLTEDGSNTRHPDDSSCTSAYSPDSHASMSKATIDTPLNRRANNSAPADASKSSPGTSDRISGLQSLPMSREVSLYQGLPNGWQFHHNNYTTACEAFLRNEDSSHPPSSSSTRSGRPRIPSVTPVIGIGYTHEQPSRDPERLPPLRSCNWNEGVQVLPFYSLPATLPVRRTGEFQQIHSSQIDPLLLALSTEPRNTEFLSTKQSQVSSVKNEPHNGDNVNTSGAASIRTTASIVRAAAPSSIDLRSLSSHKSIKSFLALRDSAALSPGSPQSLTPIVSPASSEGSYSSQLSAFPMTTTSSISPASTTLPTPGDEGKENIGDKLGKELADTTDTMKLSASLEAMCDRDNTVTIA